MVALKLDSYSLGLFEMKTVVLLHGFASSSQSTKAQYLKEKFGIYPQVEFHAFDFNPTPRDFEYVTITGMINRLRQYLLNHLQGQVSLIGSSVGALVALNYAHRFGQVDRMFLLAPALFHQTGDMSDKEFERWKNEGTSLFPHYAFNKDLPLRYDFVTDGLSYGKPVPPAAPTLVIHGRRDDVISIDNSRDYAAAYDQVQLIEVDSEHTLNDQLPFIWGQVQSFLLS